MLNIENPNERFSDVVVSVVLAFNEPHRTVEAKPKLRLMRIMWKIRFSIRIIRRNVRIVTEVPNM